MTENADIPDLATTSEGQTEHELTPPDSQQSVTPEPERRRRRRGSTGPGVSDPTGPRGQKRGFLHLLRKWTQRFLSSWGPSPTYRVLVFLVAIILVMAFLVYSEYVIDELRERERDRAAINAHLDSLVGSGVLPEQLEQLVLKQVVIKPKERLPIVFTNHRGDIDKWGGPGLPDPNDRSPEALAAVREVMDRMDAEREPIRFFEFDQVLGLVSVAGGDMVISGSDGEIITWEGPSLPDRLDTSAAALNAVRQRLETMADQDSIRVPVADSSYFYWERLNFVITDRGGQPFEWGGPVFASDSGQHEVKREKQRMAIDSAPILFRIPTEKLYHYGDSDLLKGIEFAPFVTLGVLFLFSVIGYVGFRNIRRSEQRSIWVGMAKETAHQLGTPLSSLSGWLELMAAKQVQSEDVKQDDSMDVGSIAREMQQDLSRLNQIASRFSQIGSVPELKSTDVRALLAETISYFKSRGPQFGQHRIEFHAADAAEIPLNSELMGWAFENLFKNAIDAIGRKDGQIVVDLGVAEADETIKITITDNGRGIRPEHQTRVFEPGFSTKKRGWGLGLAFVKRIVEDYHGGRIPVVESAEDKGTSFEIVLPMQMS